MLNKLKKFVQLLISDQSLIYKFLKNIFKKESNKIFHPLDKTNLSNDILKKNFTFLIKATI